jgi:toxin ParE1/3/4
MKIFYTQQSIGDLIRLRTFIEKHNLKAAKEVSDRLIQAINRLIDFPSLGRQVGDDDSNAIRDLVTGKYIIRYVVLKNEIHVLRIWHGKESVPS